MELESHPMLHGVDERKMHERHPLRLGYYGTRYRPTVHVDTLRGTSIFVSRGCIRSMPDANTLEIADVPDMAPLVGRVVTLFVQLAGGVCRTGKVLVLKRSEEAYHLVIRPEEVALLWADME